MFLEALDVFVKASLPDQYYVAERVLTASELKKYVDSHKAEGLVECLGRRLVREKKYDEARGYLSEAEVKALDQYLKLLSNAGNRDLSKNNRARSYFDAANWLRGHEQIMRLQVSPDLPEERSQGFAMLPSQEDGKKPQRHSLSVPVTQEEKKRLQRNRPDPDKSLYVTYKVLDLMWAAAALLPDNSDELADVLNTAGNWVKGDYRGDDVAADKFFQAIERRASKTELGKAAGKKHWFIDQNGPWSKAGDSGDGGAN